MGAYDELDKFQTEEGREIVSAFVAEALADEQQPAEATGAQRALAFAAAARAEAEAAHAEAAALTPIGHVGVHCRTEYDPGCPACQADLATRGGHEAEAAGGEQVQDGAAGCVERGENEIPEPGSNADLMRILFHHGITDPDDNGLRGRSVHFMPGATIKLLDDLIEWRNAAVRRAEEAHSGVDRWLCYASELENKLGDERQRAEKAEARLAELGEPEVEQRLVSPTGLVYEPTLRDLENQAHWLPGVRLEERQVYPTPWRVTPDAAQEARSATETAEGSVQASGSELEFEGRSAGLSEPELPDRQAKLLAAIRCWGGEWAPIRARGVLVAAGYAVTKERAHQVMKQLAERDYLEQVRPGAYTYRLKAEAQQPNDTTEDDRG